MKTITISVGKHAKNLSDTKIKLHHFFARWNGVNHQRFSQQYLKVEETTARWTHLGGLQERVDIVRGSEAGG